MNTEIIRLNFNNGLHIGRGSEELDKTATTYGSDALKSAIFSLGIAYYREWKEDAPVFFDSFTISSAFPFWRDTAFLPKPSGMRFSFDKTERTEEAKQAKKIAYVAAPIFSNWVKHPDDSIPVSTEQLADDSFLFHTTGQSKFLFTSVQQRVTISSDSGDTTPYYFERLQFDKNCGLYFMIQFLNENIRNKILHIINILGEVGIGTDRTVGNGQFVADPPQPIDLPTGSIRGLQMPIGLYLPSKEEIRAIDMGQSSWNLIKRGGYIAASEKEEFRALRKNSIYFFAEGSCFKSNIQLKGKLADLKPNYDNPDLHSIWRCGMPIFINL